jgi:CHAT domain-containing protein/Tfp pilus assembly protein PilF
MKGGIFLLVAFLLVLPLAQAAWEQSLQDYFKQGGEKYEISDYRGALEAWEKGLAKAKRMDNKQAISFFLNSIGLVYNDLGDYPKALSYHEQSLKISKEIGDRNGEGMTLGNIGNVYNRIGDYPKAFSYYEQSLKISKEIGDKNGEGSTLGNIGNVYDNLGDYPKALSYYEQSLKIKREIGDRNGESNILNNIGNVYNRIGDYPKALSYHEKSLKIRRKIEDKNGEGSTLGNIGNIYDNLGDYPKALSYYEQSLKIKREIGDRNGESNILNNIGNVYYKLGDYPKALSYHEQSLKISKEIGDKNVEGNNLNNIGLVYNDLGDYPKALSYYEQSLKINREIGNKNVEGYNLGNIGIVYNSLGDYPKALSYYEQSLKIKREIGDKNGESGDLNNIGNVYNNLGDYPKALSYFDQSLKVSKEIGVPTSTIELNIGDALLEQGWLKEAYEVFQRLKDPIRLGRYYVRTGDFKKAEDEFAYSVEKNEAKTIPTAEFLLTGYIGLGLSYEGLKDYPKAKGYFQKGIDLIEKQRGALGGAGRERFLEAKVQGFSRLEPYNGMIRSLIKERGKDCQKISLLYAERVKSKTFLEMLATRGVKGKTEEDKAILEKEKEYQQELRVLRKRMEVLEGLGAKAPQGELPQLKKELEKKETEFERFIKEVKLQNSELASLISVTPTPVEKIQSLLEKETTLLEYYATEETLYAWLLTKSDIKVFEIAIKEKELAKKLDEFLLPNISTRSIKVKAVITFAVGEEYKKETTEKEREKNRQNFVKAASELYQLILAPLEKEIKAWNLIIVPHGVLHKVPFSTLYDGQRYLAEKYAFSVLPSASVIENVVKKRKAEKEKLLVLANPKTDYASLEFAEIEGKTISKLFPQNEVYSGEKATETIAKKKASSFNIIHFATHGEFNDRQPLQSGLLLAKDEENDGYLQVHEIFGINLRNANLVTLSACETALAKIIGGDDLVGLSRGFIYAGTPSILATLWKVDDPATYKLMELFYKNWKQGMSKPEALRIAQMTLKNMPQYRHPYYWAPFVMIGDWK